MLARATAIDQSAEQLILDATSVIELPHEGDDAACLSRSSGSAELINHLLASGTTRVTASLRPPFPTGPTRLARDELDRTEVSRSRIRHEASEIEAEP